VGPASAYARFVATSTAPEGQPSGILVGRARELAEIEAAVDRVASGSPWTIQICGEPGIGKSRLLSELCGKAEDRGFLVLSGRAAEFEQDMPFGVVIDALNDHVASLGPAVLNALEADALGELASILPSLSDSSSGRVRAGEESERYRVHYALRALMERLAKSQPVLLALDDVHWADAASFEVLAHLLRRFQGPLLVAVAFRRAPRRLVAALETTERSGSGSRLELAPLTPEEAAALLDPQVDGETREAVYVESGGNPFYLEQLARNRGHGARFPSADMERTGEASAVPPSVIAAITHEVESLTSDHRGVMEAAAVAGERFDPRLVAAIVERDEGTVLEGLDELVAVDLIRPTAVPRRFRFRHPIVRTVAYGELPAGWRIGAHARAATALAASHAPKPELAHHVARSATAGDEHAIELLVDAAHDVASSAPLTGGRWLLAAVRLLPGDDSDRRARLLGEAGALLTSGGGFGEALEALEEALALVSADRVAVRGRLVAQRAEARRRGGRPFDSRPQMENALRSLTDPNDPTVLALRLELAMDRYWHGDMERLHELAAGVLAPARAKEDQLLVCLAASLSSLASSGRCDPVAALEELREAERAFASLSDERLAERVYLNHYVSEAAARLEYADEALSHFNRGLEAARMTGQDATSGSWYGLAVYALLLKGEIASAAGLAEEGVDPMARERDSWRMIWLLAADALAAFWRGRGDRALAIARELVTRSERAHPTTFLPGLARVRLGAALLAAGDAAATCDELVTLDSESGWWLLDLDSAHGWDMLIRARLALGAVEEAQELTDRAEARATRLPQRLATVQCARAAVLVATGEADAAVEAARNAVRLAEPTGNPLVSGRCQAQFGTALVASGEREQGTAELRRAEQALADCGAVREADAAARELRRLGGRVRRRPRPERGAGLTELSPREREVAEEVAEGKTNREVAATLFLSEKTIESHLARIYSKLDLHSRAALTAIVARQGIAVTSGDRALKTTTS